MATPLGTNKNKNLYHQQVKPFSTLPLPENLQERGFANIMSLRNKNSIEYRRSNKLKH